MNYDNPFAEEVRDNPYDDTPRLIFADFLDDNGDPLGQLIRAQIALADLPPNDIRRTPLEKQEQAIIAEHGERWLEPLRAFGAEGVSTRCFQRGMIERLRISAANFLTNAEQLCSRLPALHTLCITRLDECFERFAASRLPKQIRGLDLSTCRLGDVQSVTWRWPLMDCIEQLHDLNLRMTGTDDEAIALFCSRNLSNLQRLDLTGCGLTPRGAQTLADCATLSQLRHLKLSLNKIGDGGLLALARSSVLGNLVEFDVASNDIGHLGAMAVVLSTTLVSLERLNLRANQFPAEEFATTSSYKNLPRLREVDVRNCKVQHGH